VSQDVLEEHEAFERFLSGGSQDRSEHSRKRGDERKGDGMKQERFGRLAMAAAIILAAMAVTSQPALGQASPGYENEGTLTLTAPTTTCAGFAAGDTLTFESVAYTYREVRTWFEPGDPYGYVRYMYRMRGTTTVGGYTYTLSATTHFVADQPLAGNFSPSTGQVTIRRSDGTTLTGKAFILYDPLADQFDLTWQEPPNCR
jgi:hypothetical protein